MNNRSTGKTHHPLIDIVPGHAYYEGIGYGFAGLLVHLFDAIENIIQRCRN